MKLSKSKLTNVSNESTKERDNLRHAKSGIHAMANPMVHRPEVQVGEPLQPEFMEACTNK